MVSPARDAALDVLLCVSERDAYANLALDAELSGHPMTGRDAALATELAYGTLRARGTLDWVLARFSKRDLFELSPVVRDALRLAAYQVLYLDVPDHAAVNEAVNQVRTREHRGAAAYTNAVLRALGRGRETIPWPAREDGLAEYLRITAWHPAWLVEKWLSEIGPEQTEALCGADNAPPSLTLRVNVSRASRDEVLARLVEREIDAEPGRWMGEALRLHRAGALAGLPEHAQGLVYAQDEGSMAVTRSVAPRPGETIVDMCAAPGGKATHLAELMGGDGRVIAVDVNAKRLGLVAAAAARLGDTIVKCVEADGTGRQPTEPADRVLLDAPCSGLGVLARRAESRWRKKPEDIEELAVLQKGLLDNAARIVRPGGVLVYSTCTISRMENQDQIEGFLARHDDFEPADAARELGIEGPAGPGWMQLLPHVHGTDGIFIAKLMKRVG